MFGRASLYSPSTHPHETVVLLLNMLHNYGTVLRKPNIRGLVLSHRRSVVIFIFQTTVCARRTRTFQVIAGVCLEFWACRVLHRVVFPSIRLVRFGILRCVLRVRCIFCPRVSLFCSVRRVFLLLQVRDSAPMDCLCFSVL